ncbi:MAG TPA: hypothetical protein VK891_03255 [Euzebyales bacterium]|nr:hypothetical protein [Euzebyales bacterium]
MDDVVLGLLAMVIGALFCFRGWLMLRILIPLWGAFAGFLFGAGLVASIAGTGFLSTVMGWVVGGVLALVFGLIAYLYYEVSVVLAMAAIGFTLATTALVAMGVTWSWVVILVGVLFAVLLAFVAIIGDLPMVILAVLSAMAGASAIIGGAMLTFGVIDLADFTSDATTQRIGDDWWWYVIYVDLVIVGIIAQVRAVGRLTASMRQSWRESGGRELRTT